MAYPTYYSRQYDFVTFQNANPTRPLPADKVNADLNLVEQSIDEVIDFLKIFTRSDGQIANAVIGLDQLKDEVLDQLGGGGGGGSGSMTGAEILAALIEVDGPDSDLDADTLDGQQATAFAAASHTHTVSALSDASANAKSLLQGANYAAMRALLDLEVGTDFNAYSARLADLAGITYAQGDVFYYNGTNIVKLGAGTNGQFLKTQGAGANPAWADAPGAGGGISNIVEDVSPQLGANLDLNGWTVGDATAADLTKLHALTATAIELNYVDGVTSAIQTQLDAKQATLTTNQKTAAIEFVIDGGGSAITTGIKGDLLIPAACTITAARMLADQVGSIVVDIWKDTYANFAPTDADSITASAPPTISSAAKSEDTSLTGWTTSVSAGDILRFNVDSASTVQRVTVVLTVTITA